MNQLKMHNTVLATAMFSLLSACGGGGSTTPASGSSTPSSPVSSTTSPANASGQVINSYITGATVTLDINDDGICDSSEPKTVTDATGHYQFTGQGQHLVCATGGTNTVTAQPFVGSLTAPAGATVVTPLTTIVVEQVRSKMAAPILGKAAPLDPVAIAAAQLATMAEFSLPLSAPILTTDPVALMTKTGATLADAQLERTNAAVQVLLQQVAQSIIASANLPPSSSSNGTNIAYLAAVDGLQTAIAASGALPINLTSATTTTTRQLLAATVTNAAATIKTSITMAAISPTFSSLTPANVATAIAASPLPNLVNSVAQASSTSLTTHGGAETVAVTSTQIATVMQQISSLLTDSANAGPASISALTSLVSTLVPATGTAVSQTQANTAIMNAITTVNASLPPGSTPLTIPSVPVQAPVVIPFGQ